MKMKRFHYPQSFVPVLMPVNCIHKHVNLANKIMREKVEIFGQVIGQVTLMIDSVEHLI